MRWCHGLNLSVAAGNGWLGQSVPLHRGWRSWRPREQLTEQASSQHEFAFPFLSILSLTCYNIFHRGLAISFLELSFVCPLLKCNLYVMSVFITVVIFPLRGNLLGAAIRIDVDSGTQPYGIPADNPYQNVSGALPELCAIGFRNPFRGTMDPGHRITGANVNIMLLRSILLRA